MYDQLIICIIAGFFVLCFWIFFGPKKFNTTSCCTTDNMPTREHRVVPKKEMLWRVHFHDEFSGLKYFMDGKSSFDEEFIKNLVDGMCFSTIEEAEIWADSFMPSLALDYWTYIEPSLNPEENPWRKLEYHKNLSDTIVYSLEPVNPNKTNTSFKENLCIIEKVKYMGRQYGTSD